MVAKHLKKSWGFFFLQGWGTGRKKGVLLNFDFFGFVIDSLKSSWEGSFLCLGVNVILL